MYLLDTNILVYYLQGIKKVDSFFEIGINTIISIISTIELLGKKDLESKEILKLRDFLDTFIIVNLDFEIADKAAILRREGIKMGDAIIAATAWHFEAYLVTHDIAFRKIKKIKVIDPFDEG